MPLRTVMSGSFSGQIIFPSILNVLLVDLLWCTVLRLEWVNLLWCTVLRLEWVDLLWCTVLRFEWVDLLWCTVLRLEWVDLFWCTVLRFEWVDLHCTVQYVDLMGYCSVYGGDCDQSIGSAVSDAIVRSLLWSTATRSSPLGYFSKFLQVVDNWTHILR